ncbi:hypothetical protein [Polyangium jinanense]|uniref:Uncharacterized protein n=1 Tax=Polyangium jinanense TaxID=2829994 RepID=A0A9X4B0I5_9BACT|nr:hypothetical protein [Polyangium jinanense]MDC3962798.1 hypothetical protein [Polyangium jinanense]MDC3989525.1 hypothetical protein [Polyangium jinanense]
MGRLAELSHPSLGVRFTAFGFVKPDTYAECKPGNNLGTIVGVFCKPPA